MNVDQSKGTSKAGGGISPGVARAFRVAAWIAVAYVICDEGIWTPAHRLGVDFGKHWLAARALLGGANVYTGWELYMGFNYPQWMAFLFFWLGWMSCDTAERVWEWMLLGLLVATWWIAWRAFRPAAGTSSSQVRDGAARYWALATALTLALYLPATTCLPVGNVDPYNAVLAMGMAAALMARRDRLAGVLWAMLVLSKMLPLTLLALLVLWGRWRVIRAGAATLGLYAVLLAATGRVGYEWYFFDQIVPNITFFWRWISMSIPRAILDLTGHKALVEDSHFYRHFTMGVLLALAAAYSGALLWLRRRHYPMERAMELAFFGVPLMAPLLEFHHFVFCLPTVYLQLRRWAEGRMGTGCAWVYMVAWVHLSISHLYLDLWAGEPDQMGYIGHVSVLAILGTMAWEWVRAGRPGDAARPGRAVSLQDA
jgi:hypothetical protein